MKRPAILLVLLLSILAPGKSQTIVNYTIMNQIVNDMLYDTVSSKIILSIPSTDNIHGNSIGYIDPGNAVLEGYYFIGSEPNPLAITENGKYLYVGLDGASNVKKFNMMTHLNELTFSLGYHWAFGTFRANNISCKPGTETDVAVARISGSNAMGVAIYSNGKKLADTISYYPETPDVVHFDTSQRLYGYENSSSGYRFFTMPVDNNGVKISNQLSYLFNGYYLDFCIHNRMALSDNGTLLDLTGDSPSLSGVYKIPAGIGIERIKACFDPYLNLVCFARKSYWSDTLSIYRYNTNTFLKYDEIKIPGINSDIIKLINWGDKTKYALATKDGKLIIVNGNFSTGIINKNESLSVYPNPAINQITINAPEKSELAIVNMNDKCVQNLIAVQNNTSIDISGFAKGVYCVKIKTNSHIFTTKFIKQ